MKAHDGNYGNELADKLAKEAASRSEAEIAYNKIPKRAVIRELKEEGEEEWQGKWDTSTKGAITRSFFSTIGDRLSKRLQMNIKQSTIVTGHGTLRSYITDLKSLMTQNAFVKWAHRPQITYCGNASY